MDGLSVATSGSSHVGVDHRAHDDGDVVAGDDLLRGYLDGLDTRVDHPGTIDTKRQKECEARAPQILARAAQPEDNGAFVLTKHPDAREQTDSQDRQGPDQQLHIAPFRSAESSLTIAYH